MVPLELVAAIEEAFMIEVTDEELRVDLFQSLRSLVEYVEEKVGGGCVQDRRYYANSVKACISNACIKRPFDDG